MMDRKLPPQLKEIEQVSFVRPHIFDINEKVKLYWMKEVQNETARLDLTFDAGTIRGNRMVASMVNGLLLSGSESLSSTEISHQIDLHGGFFESAVTSENALISLYGLRENFPKLIRILKHAIEQMSFVEKEVSELIRDRKQRYQVNLQKTSFLAQRAFQERLFASDPLYSRVSELEDFDHIDLSELKLFFRENYLNGLIKVSLVGNFNTDFIDEVIDTFGSWTKDCLPTYVDQVHNEPGHYHISKEDALQTTIRVGRTLFNKTHPDYIDFQVLNTILGDYFGSRLMTNIREDKGYTYGIGSMSAETHGFGYFLIATEVGKEHMEATLKEIRLEIERLQNELVSNEELSLVKNYLLGQTLKSADGPYAMIDLFLAVQEHQLDFDFYNEAIARFKFITPQRIQELARLYLKWEDFTIVSAG